MRMQKYIEYYMGKIERVYSVETSPLPPSKEGEILVVLTLGERPHYQH